MYYENIEAIYKNMCPNCGRDISDFRLANKILCRKCLPGEKLLELEHLKAKKRTKNQNIDEFFAHLKQVIELLEAQGTKGDLEKFYNIEKKLIEFTIFFSQGLGSSPWSAQKTWARRVFLGKSFVILAPTGVGKTVFGILTALFLSRERKKSYLILPTSALVSQVYSKAVFFASKLGLNSEDIITYHGNCLLYTSPSPRDRQKSRMPSSA